MNMETLRQIAFKKIGKSGRYWKRKMRLSRPMLILVRNGTVTVRTAAGTYCAHADSSMLLAPGTFEIEATPAVRHGGMDVEMCGFSMDAFSRAFGEASHVENLALAIPASENAGVYVQKWTVSCLDRERAAVPHLMGDVEAIVMRIFNTSVASTIAFARFTFFDRRWAFQSLLETHFLRPGAVEWMADRYTGGRAAFFCDCKTFVGMSPAKWIERRRMELACGWIRHSKAGVEDIAKILGYINVRALRTALWKYFEMPLHELKDMTGLNAMGFPYRPFRPFWWPFPLPLIGGANKLVVPEYQRRVLEPEDLVTENICSGFFEMKPEAVAKIIPFPAELPELLAAA